MELISKLENLMNEYADGQDKLGELKATLKELDAVLEKESTSVLNKALKEVGAISTKFDNPKNPDFGNFLFDLSMWIYDWKKKDVKANPPDRTASCENDAPVIEFGN